MDHFSRLKGADAKIDEEIRKSLGAGDLDGPNGEKILRKIKPIID